MSNADFMMVQHLLARIAYALDCIFWVMLAEFVFWWAQELISKLKDQ